MIKKIENNIAILKKNINETMQEMRELQKEDTPYLNGEDLVPDTKNHDKKGFVFYTKNVNGEIWGVITNSMIHLSEQGKDFKVVASISEWVNDNPGTLGYKWFKKRACLKEYELTYYNKLLETNKSILQRKKELKNELENDIAFLKHELERPKIYKNLLDKLQGYLVTMESEEPMPDNWQNDLIRNKIL